MTSRKAQAQSWLERAHDWLFAFDDLKLHRSVQNFRGRMLAALGSGDDAGASYMMDKLLAISDRFQDAQHAEMNEPCVIQAGCAYVAHQVGDIYKALKLLETALELCSGHDGGHFEGTAKWMLGWIQWDLGLDSEAIFSWESGMDIYRNLGRGSAHYLSDATAQWYTARLAEMTAGLDEALGGVSPAQPLLLPAGPEPAPEDASIVLEEDILRLFTISNGIKAGQFGSTDAGRQARHVEVDRVQINGRAHRIVNLRGSGRVIRPLQSREYDVISVHGDSMNAEGIDHGDFILLQYQSSAENNDIVAARIQDVDETATLKRFLMRGTSIILKFCSRNPIHKDAAGRDKQFVFDLHGEGFEIIGIAIAVFKPL